MPKNFYEILSVDKSASQDEIKKAYRRLAHRYHPDKKKEGSDEKMKELNYIYSVLSEFHQRKSYDETLDYSFAFEESDFDFEKPDYRMDIYCNDLDVIDSTGRQAKIKTGDSIYYEVEIDKSIITWKHKSKEYFNVYIKKILNPEKGEYFSEVFKYNPDKEPLCIVDFAGQDLIIYKDEFESYWLSEENYKKLDRKKGLITAGIIALVLVYGLFYLVNTYKPTSEQQEKFRNKYASGQDVDYRNYLKKEYLATDGEINYIATERYQVCDKKTAKLNDSTYVTNAPSSLSLSAGDVKKDTEVKILLFDDTNQAYKIQSDGVSGWIPLRFLDNPKCEELISN